MSVEFCRICKQPLDVDYLSTDCGGDCLMCMATVGGDTDCIESVVKHYPDFVTSLFKAMNSTTEYVMHATIGIAGEGGELLDAAKKYWVYNKPLDTANVKEELGDTLFYIQALANFLDCSIEELMVANVAKLRKRYPKGYTDAAAQARADKS